MQGRVVHRQRREQEVPKTETLDLTTSLHWVARVKRRISSHKRSRIQQKAIHRDSMGFSNKQTNNIDRACWAR